MKILVTGGAGYIGSAAVEQLIAAGESVVVFDNLSQGHRAAVHPAAVFVKGDLSDRAEIDGALSDHRPDAVMHFAAKSLVGESMERPFLYLGGNVRNGLNLFESVVEHGVKRIILGLGSLRVVFTGRAAWRRSVCSRARGASAAMYS
jgi:UDP-glucose 4-epimerase